jgi:pSer/pThr/pTyr-binding forkhead associated (FHA) protein
MPSLILLLENCDRHIYPLGRATLLVGRGDASTIQLPSDNVAMNHASIVYTNEQFLLRDNGSTNGSFVNGKKTGSSHALKHHDLVRFGEYLFLVDMEDNTRETTSPKSEPPSQVASKNSKINYKDSVEIATSRPRIPATHLPPSDNVGDDKLRLLLTEPIVHSRLASSGKTKTKSSSNNIYTAVFTTVLTIILSGLASLLIVASLLPFGAREAMVKADGFDSFPLHGAIRKFLIREDRAFESKTIVLDGTSFGTKMKIPKSARILGQLQLNSKTDSPFRIVVTVSQEKGEISQKLIHETVEVAPGSNGYIQLFSTVLSPGNYSLQCVAEEGPYTPGIESNLVIVTQS